MRAPIQAEAAPRQVIDFFLVIGADGKQAITAAVECITQGLCRLADDGLQVVALELAAFMQQLPRCDVGVNDRPGLGYQQHRHRRVLDHGVEQ